MRSLAVWLAVFVILGLTAAPAWAVWVWRDGRWQWVEETEPQPSAAPERPESAPPPIEPTPGSGPRQTPDGWEDIPVLPHGTRTAEREQPAPEVPGPAAKASPKRPWWKRWWRQEDSNADRTLFGEGKEAYLSGRHRKAERSFKSLIKRYPGSAYRAEAMWLRSESLFTRKEYYKAFEQYEELIAQYAGSPHYCEALEREIEIAERYLGPARRRVLGVPMLSGETEALEILRRVYEHQPTGDLAEACLVRIADYYWDKQAWQEAEDYYDRYCREHPNGRRIVHAELRRAKSTIEKCRGVRYDTTSLALAYDRLRQFQQKYPEKAQGEGVAELLGQLQERQAESLYEIAAYYHRAGRPLAAAYYAERVQQRFADSPWSKNAANLLEQMSLKKEPNQ